MGITVENPNPPIFSYKFQGIFNSSVSGEITKHTESKMIIFASGPLQSLKEFFFKFCTCVYAVGTKEAEMINVHQNLVLTRRFCAEGAM